MAAVTLTAIVHVEAPRAAFTPVPPTVKVPVPGTAVIVGVPLQVPATPLGVAIARPGGKPSVKVRPLRAGAPAGLVMVKVRIEFWPTPTVAGLKALVSVGSDCTVSVALTAEVVTLAVPVMLAASVLAYVPATLLVTSTVTVHEACAAFIVAPVTVMTPLPAAAVTAPVPDGHELVTFGVAATTTLAGSVSVKLMPDWAGLPAPFVSVKVSVEIPPWSIVAGAKALASEACDTVSVWFVTALVIPEIAVICAAPFTFAPTVVPVTVSVIVHVCPAFTAIADAVNGCVPLTAVNAGVPHCPLVAGTGGLAIVRPAGSVSVNESPVRFTEPPAVLATVKVSVVAWPRPRLATANALVSTGSACTVRVALTPVVVTLAAPVMLAAFVLL